MKATRLLVVVFAACIVAFGFTNPALAALTLTAGSSATTTPSVATSITGFQIVGPAASTTPVKLRATSGTLTLSVVSGVTMSGNNSGTVNLSGTVAALNTALSTLTYTRGSTGTDTLEVSLVNPSEVFFSDNGHLYQFVSGSYTWSAAKTAAEAQTAYGVFGYLATIASSSENTFVYNRITGDGWLGTTDTDTEKTWKWMTGPDAGTAYFQENPSGGGGNPIGGRYHAWASGEPNDYNNDEDCGYMYSSQGGEWNDYPCNTSQGYVAEFGSGSNLPTVVAANISVVTADVPAVTSLSPANGAIAASPNANLVIGFSKSVTKQTGNILIRKSSDNSLVEAIDASGGLLSGSGTNTITINPNTTLDEGTQYYVIVPSTAFKDSSNNFFDGINASTTWVFTTSDITAPIISNLYVSATAGGATITWATNEAASTKVVYSSNALYASSTTETDTSSRVLSHSKSITGLLACTLYNFKAVSSDAAGNYATSTSSTFTTTGCAGGASPSSATSTTVAVSAAATSTISDAGRTLAVATPANFTATSSSVIIQIKGLPSAVVLDSIGKPASLSSAATVVFNVTALINNVTELDSFNAPVTVSYTYTDADISGLSESSLKMYHYKNSAWEELNSCSVNEGANTITCTAPHFSIFAIFGTALPPSNSSSAGGSSSLPWCSGPLAPGWNAGLVDGGCGTVALAVPMPAANTQSTSICPSYSFTRTLRFGMRGEDVHALQKLMNCLGFKLGESGPGSPGEETNLFVERTFASVQKFQETYSSEILVPIKTTKGTGIFAEYSRKKVRTLSGN